MEIEKKDRPVMNFLSLGAGWQSTTMALMAAHGEITPMPDAGIMVDTGAEPKGVYETVRFLSSGNVLPYPIIVVKPGDLADDILKSAEDRTQRVSNPPLYTVKDGKAGMLGRSCTRDYKIYGVRREAKRIYQERHGKVSEGCIKMWIGISSDEASRWSESAVKYIENRHPFLEKATNVSGGSGLWFSRNDCAKWLAKHGYPTPTKSACSFCPMRSNASWKQLRDTDPEAWEQAIKVDNAIRNGLYNMNADQAFVHRSNKPLEEVDLDKDADMGEFGFVNDCEGGCGL
jgi:hypothetical protein